MVKQTQAIALSDKGGNEAEPPLWWCIAILALTAVWAGLQLPYGLSFQPYIGFDLGWPLRTDSLIREGLIPTQDFAYYYGLLSLLLDRGWFYLFGTTPQAQAALCVVCAFLLCGGVIRFAGAANLGLWPRIVLLAFVPFAIMPGFYATPVHAFEPVLLAHALAYQARGRLSAALSLATLCVFVKPGMADVYGLVLLLNLFFARDPAHQGRQRWLALVPAAVIGVVIAAVLGLRFGFSPLWHTLLPLSAASVYRAENYGFWFGSGRTFWLPKNLNPLYYLFSPAGVWIGSTLILVAGGVRALLRGRGSAAATVATCAALHLAFVFFLFGKENSWVYFSFILALGLSGVLNRSGIADGNEKKSSMIPAIIFSLLALISAAVQIRGCIMFTRQFQRHDETCGLYSSRQDVEAWRVVRALPGRVLVMSTVGCAQELFVGLESPSSWFLLEPVATPKEIESLRDKIDQADWIVIPVHSPRPYALQWRLFNDKVPGFKMSLQFQHLHSCVYILQRLPKR